MPRYLDTINSNTGELNTISALNLIVFGAKLEHLDLIEYVVVDLLKVKWSSFIRREFFKQMFIFLVFFLLGMFCFVVRPLPQGTCKLDSGNSTDFENGTTTTTTTTTTSTTTTTTTTTTMMTEIISGLVTGLPILANETNQTSEESLVTSCGEGEGDLVIETGLGVCYLHVMDTPIDKIRMAGEVVLVVMGIYFILKVCVITQLSIYHTKRLYPGCARVHLPWLESFHAEHGSLSFKGCLSHLLCSCPGKTNHCMCVMRYSVNAN